VAEPAGLGANRRRPGPLADGSDARLLLLDAAEELFARHGVEAVSLRAITAAAGLTTATIHYHFRSRDDLLRAILERRRAPLLDYTVFDELESGRRQLTVRALVHAVLEPWIRLIRQEPKRGPLFLRLYSQLLAARDQRLQDSLGPVTDQFRRLYSRLPGAASSPLRWGIAIDCLIHELAAIAELQLRGAEFDEYTSALEDFVASGLSGAR
jgi:AcrR family transcriptional regulator